MTNENRWNPQVDRRYLLRIGAVGAVGLTGLGSVRKALGDCTLNPAQTQGPYWVDEMLSRSDIRSDPSNGVVQRGLLLRLGISISENTGGACAPMSGASVDVWHCNASGVYSDVQAQNTVGQRFLRGYQVADSHGNVRYLTIYPGYYTGRTVHIHFRVRKFSGATTTFNFVSQLYFDDAITDAVFQRVSPYSSRPARTTRNSNDGIYSSQMLLRLSDNGAHAIGSFNVAINSVPGLRDGGLNLSDSDDEHADDLGGGSPPADLER